MADHPPGRVERCAGAGNQLLASLPEAARERLRANLHPIALHAGQSLFQAGAPGNTAYFAENAVISLLARSSDGYTLDVGVVGRDGAVGTLLPGVDALPYEALVQIGGMALRIDAALLRGACRDQAALNEVLGRHAHCMLATSVQAAVCNTFHSVQQRCARWLLTLHDLVGDDQFPLTQNALALMLGVRRPSVTLAASALHRGGIVEYCHGRMTVRDRSGLEGASCSCYRLMRDERQRLLGY